MTAHIEHPVVSAAFQFVPVKGAADPIAVIDEIIAVIQASGCTYQVCPFETAVEGTVRQIMDLQYQILQVAQNRAGLEFLLYVKFHAAAGAHRRLHEKTDKFYQ